MGRIATQAIDNSRNASNLPSLPPTIPFCFYNGNTFAAIGRTMVQELTQKMSPVKAHAFRSAVGHFIAGTAGERELEAALADIN
jgi:hypothetical protein